MQEGTCAQRVTKWRKEQVRRSARLSWQDPSSRAPAGSRCQRVRIVLVLLEGASVEFISSERVSSRRRIPNRQGLHNEPVSTSLLR